MKIPDNVNSLLVENLDAPENFEWCPENDGQKEVDEISEQPLPEGREGQAFQLSHPRCLMRVKAAGGQRGRGLLGWSWTRCNF